MDIFQQVSSNSSIHSRIRNLLRRHTCPHLLVNTEHPILIPEPAQQRRRFNAATEEFEFNRQLISDMSGHNAQINQVNQHLTNSAISNLQRLSSSSTRGRNHILGFERAIIHCSTLPVKTLARAYHCSMDTIYRIQKDPLALYGITSRQLSSIIKDLIDSNLMLWFSNSSGAAEFVLPPVDFQNRCGPVRKLTLQHTASLRVILESHPELYLDEIHEILTFLDPMLDISISTLSRHILKMGYSRKKSSKVIDKADYFLRTLYCQALQLLVTNINQLVFLDEATNARNSLTRQYSRSSVKISSRGKSYTPTSRVSFIGAISVNGIVEFDLIENTVTSVDFTQFVQETLLHRMNAYPNENSILILDNARAHSPEIVDYAFNEYGVLVIFLPPYSPDLNPIERFFSSIKATFKRYVGQDPSLRRNPYLLWLMAISHCDQVINYRSLICDTYQFDNRSGELNIIMC